MSLSGGLQTRYLSVLFLARLSRGRAASAGILHLFLMTNHHVPALPAVRAASAFRISQFRLSLHRLSRRRLARDDLNPLDQPHQRAALHPDMRLDNQQGR